MIQNFPPELLFHIFRYACVDEGVTARSLSLTSKYVSSVSSQFLFNTLHLASVDSLQCAVRRLSSLPPHLRQVYHLFVSDLGRQTPAKSKPDLSECFTQISSDLFSQILLLTAPTLRTLTVIIRTARISSIPECIAHTAMHDLTDLTLSFNPTRISVPLDPASRSPPSANLPRLRHLHIDTCHVLSSTVAPAVALITAHAPRLATLHVSDVLLMPGCAAVLARMLGRLPLRDSYGWVIPEDVIDSTARLPFSVREFALQVRDWPMTFVPELALVEVMASMDYGDGFVLLPPGRESRPWKKEWLARVADRSLEDV
ncbi:hypothetical protein EDB83DRAFT_2394208 [Lactarius deliciosus]|nr:hypothetical protein EDB83DRAFT_2394208 [Lactarius deliciosus]